MMFNFWYKNLGFYIKLQPFKLCWYRSGLAEFCSLWDSSSKLAYPLWTLVVNWLLPNFFPFQNLRHKLFSLTPTSYSYSSYQKKRFLILPPNFEFLASVCLHFSIFRTLANRHFIDHNKINGDVCKKKLAQARFKYYLQNAFRNHIFKIFLIKDLALNDPQWSICHKT